MKRVWIAKICFSLASVFLTSVAYSQVYFKHKDWEVACDNTGTCRAAGYQPEGEEPVSMLITRLAGQGVKIDIDVKVADSTGYMLSGEGDIRVPGHATLLVSSLTDSPMVQDEKAVVFIRALLKGSIARVTLEGEERKLSLQGLHAVLLKMDEVQKRVKTKNALVAIGSNDERGVALEVLQPKITVAVLPEKSEQVPSFIESAIAAIPTSECQVTKANFQPIKLNATRYLLVRTPCWINSMGEYSNGFWVVDQASPKSPQRIGRELPLQDFRNGQIHGASNTLDGLQACGVRVKFTWNGNEFVKTSSSNSELCRGFRGGAWDLQTLIYQVEGFRAFKKKAKKNVASTVDTEISASDLARARAAAGAAAKAAMEAADASKEKVK